MTNVSVFGIAYMREECTYHVSWPAHNYRQLLQATSACDQKPVAANVPCRVGMTIGQNTRQRGSNDSFNTCMYDLDTKV